MLHTLRLGPRAWSGIVVGIFLAAFLGQSFIPASVGVAQWETSTPTATLSYNAALTSSQQFPLEPLTTTFPFDTSTPTPNQLLPLEPLITLSPFDTSTPNPSQQLSSESLIPLLPLATSTRTPTPINLGNFVWDDLDADGVQDAGEPGVAGVTMQLWNSARTSLIASTLTSGTGAYTLVAPIPGDYHIRVLLSAGNQFTAKDQGFDDTRDSDINTSGTLSGFTDLISIASNVIAISSLDAGIIVFKTPTPTRTPTPISIGNFIWRDSDADGIQDAGEIGVPNVVVQLWNTAKTQLIQTTITNNSGIYTLVAPYSGDYRIRVLLPVAQALFSPKLQGLDATKDSNINQNGMDFGFTDIISIAPNVISTTIYDAGMTNLPAVLPSPSFLPLILK